MCTRSRTQRNKNESENKNIIDSVRHADIICFEENCVSGSHSQACKTKAKNMLRAGDIYDKQKAFFSFESDSDSEEEEEEEEQEEQDIGLGGSSPIPSIHHSFEEDDTLTHGNEVEDQFSQEEEEEDEQTTQDEQFLSVLSELNTLNSSIDESAKKSQTKSEKFKGASDALREMKRLKEKWELLLPNISPQLRTQVYRKID